MDLEKRFGKEKIFEVRKMERDSSFIRKYLTEELCKELNLFEYGKKGNDYVINEVADELGWKEIRNTIAASVGMSSLPLIKVTDMSLKDRTLTIEHEYDGRELELTYAYETLKYLSTLWGAKIVLKTVIEQGDKLIVCDENKKITMNKA